MLKIEQEIIPNIAMVMRVRVIRGRLYERRDDLNTVSPKKIGNHPRLKMIKEFVAQE